MHFPHLHFIFFEQAIRLTEPANESGKTRPDSTTPAPNHIACEKYPLALGNFIQGPRGGR